MASKRLHLLTHVSDIKQFDKMVSRGRDQPVAILVPLGVHHSIFMSVPGGTKKIAVVLHDFLM